MKIESDGPAMGKENERELKKLRKAEARIVKERRRATGNAEKALAQIEAKRWRAEKRVKAFAAKAIKNLNKAAKADLKPVEKEMARLSGSEDADPELKVIRRRIAVLEGRGK